MTAERLYGIPNSETLYDDIGSAYESQVEPWADEHDRRSWVIEEWSVHPPKYHLRSADDIVDWLIESASEGGDIGEECAEDLEKLARVPEVLAAAEALLDILAGLVTYRMADRRVAEHAITWDAEDEPLLNGQRLYVRRTVSTPGGAA